MKILVSFSGGLDSTYLVWWLLTNTTYEIHVVRWDLSELVLSVENATEIDQASSKRIQDILNWLAQNVRPVASYQSRKITKFEHNEWVTPSIVRAGAAMMAEGYDQFCTGRTLENTAAHRGAKNTPLFQALFRKLSHGKELTFPLIELGKGRPHFMQELPKELLDMTFSCVNPKDGAPCGTCIKCRIMTETKTMLESGITADKILEFHLRKKRAGRFAKLGVTHDRNYRTAEAPTDAAFYREIKR